MVDRVYSLLISCSVQTSNGIQQEESGQLKQVQGAESQSYATRGQFTYTGTDGQQYTVTYIADENGEFFVNLLH